MQNGLVNKVKRPVSALSELALKGAGFVHTDPADWVMQFMPEEDCTRILKIGGEDTRIIGRLMRRYTRAKITAAESSLESVKKVVKDNKTFVDAGRCDVFKADAAILPVEDEKFDLAVAVDSSGVTADTESCVKEVYRALKPGGMFIIAAAKCNKTENIADCLQRAGFARAEAMRHIKLPWTAIAAQK
ncbi:MAG: methyltransferase domain-containing protein [Clostridia bacterium]|nr:methyltransferase domain-containing protein [Clostridia bacterium]